MHHMKALLFLKLSYGLLLLFLFLFKEEKKKRKKQRELKSTKSSSQMEYTAKVLTIKQGKRPVIEDMELVEAMASPPVDEAIDPKTTEGKLSDIFETLRAVADKLLKIIQDDKKG